MAMNRRAVIYTLGVVLFLTVILLLVTMRHQVDDIEETDLFVVRAESVDRFITDFEQDLDRVAYITGYRTFLAMEEYVSETGMFLDNASDAFLQIFFNGTFNGTTFTIMNDSTFSDYLDRIKVQAHKINVDMEANVSSAELTQTNPWYVTADIEISATFTDISGFVSWDFVKTYDTHIPIYDIKDPMYSVYTYGLVSNVIVPTNVTVFISADNDTSGLQAHANNSWYINSTSAPSILMRFEGNHSASPYGIESLVNTPLLSTQGIPVDGTKTVVDYLFFDNQSHIGTRIVNMSDWFRLDNGHLSTYDAVDKTR